MSPRPKSIRKVRGIPMAVGFTPMSRRKAQGTIVLYIEEYEAIHLCDYDNKTQAEAAECMGISRPTLTRIYASARKKLADALINQKNLVIEGGTSYMDAQWFRCEQCGMILNNIIPHAKQRTVICPICKTACTWIDETEIIQTNYANMKKIALPTRNGEIDDHFGHCEFYTIITVNEENQIVMTETIPSPQGCGCKSNIASKLQADGVTIMLAGNMGAGALNKLSACGIEVIRGCKGNVTDVVNAYLNGAIHDSGEGCHHHHDGDHQCQH